MMMAGLATFAWGQAQTRPVQGQSLPQQNQTQGGNQNSPDPHEGTGKQTTTDSSNTKKTNKKSSKKSSKNRKGSTGADSGSTTSDPNVK